MRILLDVEQVFERQWDMPIDIDHPGAPVGLVDVSDREFLEAAAQAVVVRRRAEADLILTAPPDVDIHPENPLEHVGP